MTLLPDNLGFPMTQRRFNTSQHVSGKKKEDLSVGLLNSSRPRNTLRGRGLSRRLNVSSCSTKKSFFFFNPKSISLCQPELACTMADSHLVCTQVGIVLPDTLSGWQSPGQARFSSSLEMPTSWHKTKGKRMSEDCQQLLARWDLLQDITINYNKIKFNCNI